MNKRNTLFFALLLFLNSCAIPLSEQISGNYSGQYTNNASVIGNGTVNIAANGNDAADVTISAPGFDSVIITNVALTGDNGEIALYKVNFIDVLAGSYNDGELSLSYTSIGGVISFIGSKN